MSLFGLEGRAAVVIGAGSGIGRAVASGCARQGAAVTCVDIDLAAAKNTADRISAHAGTAIARALDVREAEAVAAVLAEVRDLYGRLDVVIATPAMNVRKKLVEYTEDEFDRVVDLNLKGSFNVLRAAGVIMTRDRRGSIVLFASIRAEVIEPGQSVYGATKAGVVQLVKAAAAEFGPSGVRVNAVAPGIVSTPLTAEIQSHPDWYRAYVEKSVLKRWALPEEMVGPTIFLASDAASYVTGTVLFADGGWTAADGRFQPPGME